MRIAGYTIKDFLPTSLFGRSLLILVVPVLLIQVITTYVFFDRHWGKITARLAFSVAGEITVFASAVEEGGLDPQELQALSRYYGESLAVKVKFVPGAELPAQDKKGSGFILNTMATQTLTQELRGMLKRPFVVHTDFQEKWIRVSTQLTNGVLEVSLPSRRLFSSSNYIFLLWMMGSSAVLLVVAIFFMRNQIRPIRKLAVAADRFGKGRDVGPFRPSGAREVRQAAQAFLDMHTRIRRQIEQRTAMLAGVSHDLRTPLTRLKLHLEMLGNNSDIVAMKGDVQDMERMIAGYLDFVRGEGDEEAVLVNLGEFLEKIVSAARRQDIDITLGGHPNMAAMIKPMAFERCLVNIISNAGRHAKHVWVSAAAQKDDILEILIDDDGPGIPADQYEEVFRPFYRVDTSRNAATGGVGLGLSIAMDIVHSHGGHISLAKSPQGGLRVIIHIPK